MVLSGLIGFCKAVPFLCLRGRWLRIGLNVVYSLEADLQKTVTLCPQAKRDLQWIISLSPHQSFAPLVVPVPRSLRPRGPNKCITRASAFGSRISFTNESGTTQLQVSISMSWRPLLYGRGRSIMAKSRTEQLFSKAQVEGGT
jgi:hypothetical protein